MSDEPVHPTYWRACRYGSAGFRLGVLGTWLITVGTLRILNAVLWGAGREPATGLEHLLRWGSWAWGASLPTVLVSVLALCISTEVRHEPPPVGRPGPIDLVPLAQQAQPRRRDRPQHRAARRIAHAAGLGAFPKHAAKAVPSPASLSVSAIATAARFSAGASPVSSSQGLARAKPAHSSAIFRRVVSSKTRVMPLDYNRSAFDEMCKDT